MNLIAGGCSGFVESSICHPLDTIKTRMQLRRQTVDTKQKLHNSLVEPALRLKHSLQEPFLREPRFLATTTHNGSILHEPTGLFGGSTTSTIGTRTTNSAKIIIQPMSGRGTVQATLGPIGTAKRIVQREGFFALYKGLTAVYTGIIPKMAIRFVSFEYYKDVLTIYCGAGSSGASGGGSSYFSMGKTSITLTAGLASGLTEAILVVTPAEVCKIRMQSQYHSLNDPTQMQHRKYTNVLQTAATIVREEGIGALYKGIVPTMLRQGCNQAVNFTAYSAIKRKVLDYQQTKELYHWQSLLIGGISGGMGPMVNNPLDVVKTRLQKQVVVPGKVPKYTGLLQACIVIAKEEGFFALWKGITPRLLRIMPGQAITFMTYEAVSSTLIQWGVFS
jgi:solute carrier family 25 citrate transporter 1